MRALQFRRLIPALGLIALITAAASGEAFAQQSPALMEAHLFEGSCAELTDPIRQLRDVTNDDPRVGGSFGGSTSAFGVLTSESDVRIRLSTLLGSPHAIVIGDPAEPVACGDIGGITSRTSDSFRIGIAPIGDSGVFGIAEIEDDDDETEIDLYIAAPFE